MKNSWEDIRWTVNPRAFLTAAVSHRLMTGREVRGMGRTLEDAAEREATRINWSCAGRGDGFGSSDFVWSLRDVLVDAGVPVRFVRVGPGRGSSLVRLSGPIENAGARRSRN